MFVLKLEDLWEFLDGKGNASQIVLYGENVASG